MEPVPQAKLLGDLLRDVSRSFYLTLRMLPDEIRHQISLAYLLARATDTIADTPIIPQHKRIGVLTHIRDCLTSQESVPALEVTQDWLAIIENQKSSPEKRLLKNFEACLVLLRTFALEDQQLILDLLSTIIRGQLSDLEYFPGENESSVFALKTSEQLDQYTYLVAGCVGEFWTHICARHFGELKHWSSDNLLSDAIRFGKGLQLINILRDLPSDLRRGRCYLPQSELVAAGLTASDLLAPDNAARLRPIFDKHLDLAMEHLDAGWRYTMSIPPSLWKLRLACAWPILIGAKTVRCLRHSSQYLDPSIKTSIRRDEVYLIMAVTFLRRRDNKRLTRYYSKLSTRRPASH